MTKLILDAMGGDHAPSAILEGALKALPELKDIDELVILGDEAIIRRLLQKSKLKALGEAITQGDSRTGCKVRLLHSGENIEMEDSIRAVRAKPNATINIGSQMAAKDYASGIPSAFVSAGNSGAMMASALLHMGRLAGVERPAIAVKLPSLSKDGCVVLDVGANIDCKPQHLRDFAVMGALFAQVERKSPGLPKVGVLSNGEERIKGTETTRAALELIDQLGCFNHPGHAASTQAIGNFIGYVEGKEIFKGNVDVVVADGFVGNLVLKSVEGLGSAVVSLIKREQKRSILAQVGFLLSAGVLLRIKRKLDYAETGAAPLLGVAGYAFVCHGRSNSRAMKNALLRAQSALRERFVERLEQAVAGATCPHKEPQAGG